MKIFIVGFMGSGKTSCGKRIAKKLNLDFYDLDEYIEANEKKTVSEIFDKYGERFFRKLEQQYLRRIYNKDNLVVATGGGTPCFFSNMDEINKNGTSIYLKMSDKALFSRLENSKSSRPLLQNLNQDELFEFIKTSMNLRCNYYEKSKIIIDALSLNMDELCEKLDAKV